MTREIGGVCLKTEGESRTTENTENTEILAVPPLLLTSPQRLREKGGGGMRPIQGWRGDEAAARCTQTPGLPGNTHGRHGPAGSPEVGHSLYHHRLAGRGPGREQRRSNAPLWLQCRRETRGRRDGEPLLQRLSCLAKERYQVLGGFGARVHGVEYHAAAVNRPPLAASREAPRRPRRESGGKAGRHLCVLGDGRRHRCGNRRNPARNRRPR
jgi:hypothetical protein